MQICNRSKVPTSASGWFSISDWRLALSLYWSCPNVFQLTTDEVWNWTLGIVSQLKGDVILVGYQTESPNWVVVWKMFYVKSLFGETIQFDEDFSDGLVHPPTRCAEMKCQDFSHLDRIDLIGGNGRWRPQGWCECVFLMMIKAGMLTHMDVSENSGTPKSSILIGFSITNHPFWGTTIFGNTHMFEPSWLWILVRYQFQLVSCYTWYLIGHFLQEYLGLANSLT